MLSWKRSINVQLKNQNSIRLEDYEESISLTLRTRSSRKPWGMQEENWKHDMQEKQAWSCKTDDFKSKFARILEASESTRMRMEESLPKYHEDHIAGRGDNSLQYYNLVHKFLALCLKQWRYPQQKQQWIRNGKIGKDSGVGHNKSQK